MTPQSEREKNLENMFAKQEIDRFKIKARKAKLLAIWASEQLNKSEDKARLYVDQIMDFALNSKGEEQYIERIFNDLQTAGLRLTKSDVEKEAITIETIATEQIEYINNNNNNDN